MRYAPLGVTLTGTCPRCGEGDLLVRTRRVDGEPFLSCSRFPACRCALPYVDGLAEIRAEIETLRSEVSQLRAHGSVPPAAGPQDPARLLREILVRFHPDKRGATVATLEVAQAVGEAFNLLRQARTR